MVWSKTLFPRIQAQSHHYIEPKALSFQAIREQEVKSKSKYLGAGQWMTETSFFTSQEMVSF